MIINYSQFSKNYSSQRAGTQRIERPLRLMGRILSGLGNKKLNSYFLCKFLAKQFDRMQVSWEHSTSLRSRRKWLVAANPRAGFRNASGLQSSSPSSIL